MVEQRAETFRGLNGYMGQAWEDDGQERVQPLALEHEEFVNGEHKV